MRFRKLKKIIAGITLSATFVTSLNCNFAGAIKTKQEVIDLLSLINSNHFTFPHKSTEIDEEALECSQYLLSFMLPYFESIDSKNMRKDEILTDLENRLVHCRNTSEHDSIKNFFNKFLDMDVSIQTVDLIHKYWEKLTENEMRFYIPAALGQHTGKKESYTDRCEFALDFSKELLYKSLEVSKNGWTDKIMDEYDEGLFYLAIYCYINIKEVSSNTSEEILQVLRCDADNFLKKLERLPVYEKIEQKREILMYEISTTLNVLIGLIQRLLSRPNPNYKYASTQKITRQDLEKLSKLLLLLATDKQERKKKDENSMQDLLLQDLSEYKHWIDGYLKYEYV